MSMRTRVARTSLTLLALTLALAGTLWTPTFAAAQPPASEPETFDGTLEVVYEDSELGSRLLHFLETGGRRLPLRFQRRVPELPSGSRVRVRGNAADDGVTVSDINTIAVSDARTMGQQDVLVILFNFSNDTRQPYTPSSTGTVNGQVQNFYLENSYGQTRMTFTVTGWHTIAASNATCDYYTFASQAEAAASAAGYDPTAYDRRLLAFPQTSACSWWGMGNVAGPRAWVNGSYALRVVAHELGHNFGNHHSMARRCDGSTCTDVEYGDDRDVMGASGTIAHTNAFQKERLGWLNYGQSPPLRTVATSGSYWLEAVSAANTGNAKGLKVWNPNTGTYYYVEARARTGFDGTIAQGVVVHSGSPTTARSSYQLDMAPLTTTWDSTLDPGQSFSDTALGVYITTLSTDATGAMVQVDFGSLPCTTVAPTVSMSPLETRWGRSGAALGYTVSVRNNNTAGCAPSRMNLAAATNLSSGWMASFGSPSLTLAPGASASTSATLTPAASTPAALYTISMAASDASTSLNGNAAGNAWVAPNLNVAVAASVIVQNRDDTVSVTAQVRIAGTTAVPGGAVTVTLRNPVGATTTASGTTDTNGNVTVRFRLSRRRDPSGNYTATVVADKNGISGTGSAQVAVR